MSNSTGPRPNSDTNYGLVGDKTLRTASQLGNEDGEVDYGYGLSTAQTVRVILAADSEVNQGLAWVGVAIFDEQAAVPVGTETTIVSYTPAVDLKLKSITGSGEADAKFNLKIDGTTVQRRRNNWCDRNVTFDLDDIGLNVLAGQTVTMTVLSSGDTAKAFDGTIIGEERRL